jgi:hypothetical protein
MLPNLGALPLVATAAKDDEATVRQLQEAWDAAEEEQEEEEALVSQLAELRTEQEALRAREVALREEYRSKRRAAPAIQEVFGTDDLVKEVLLAINNGDASWEVCKMVTRFCALDKARDAACDDAFYEDLCKKIWGELPDAQSLRATGQNRFRQLCLRERSIVTGDGRLQDHPYLSNLKRVVLAAIAASARGNYRVLSHASPALRDDEEVVRAATNKNFLALRYASPRLQAIGDQFVKMTNFWPFVHHDVFERRWGTAVLVLMTTMKWTELTLNVMVGILQANNTNPDTPPRYFGARKRKFKDLMLRIMKFMMQENATVMAMGVGFGEPL